MLDEFATPFHQKIQKTPFAHVVYLFYMRYVDVCCINQWSIQ
jgi:hypothetical protein